MPTGNFCDTCISGLNHTTQIDLVKKLYIVDKMDKLYVIERINNVDQVNMVDWIYALGGHDQLGRKSWFWNLLMFSYFSIHNILE